MTEQQLKRANEIEFLVEKHNLLLNIANANQDVSKFFAFILPDQWDLDFRDHIEDLLESAKEHIIQKAKSKIEILNTEFTEL